MRWWSRFWAWWKEVRQLTVDDFYNAGASDPDEEPRYPEEEE
jgi:hypothetical protein